MATSQDIREWATANEIEVNPRGPIPREIKDRFYEASGETAPEPVAADEAAPGGGSELGGNETTPGEVPPAAKPKLWGRRKKTGAAVVKRQGPRQNTEGLFSAVWSGLANILGSTGMVPTARVLQLQAPVAGAILDRELRGTRVDRMAQPVAKMFNRSSSVGTLVALPLMVHMVTVKPELYGMIKPHMVEALYRWYEIAGPEMEKQQKKMEKRREQLGGLDPEELLNMIFSADVPPEAPEE